MPNQTKSRIICSMLIFVLCESFIFPQQINYQTSHILSIEAAEGEETTVYAQNFDSETTGTYPSGWTVVSGSIGAFYSVTVTEGIVHAYDIYPTHYLILCDAQSGSHVDMYRALSTSVINGSFEFDYWFYGVDYWQTYHQIILEDALGNDIIPIVFEAQLESTWHFYVGGTRSPSNYPMMASTSFNFMINFTESQIDVFIDGEEVLSDIAYSGASIRQIRFLTADAASNQGESWMDDFNLTAYSISEEELTLAAPILNIISPNPDRDGLIVLNWNDIDHAAYYEIYRALIPISSISGLTPIGSTIQSKYTDSINFTSDTFYYVAVARNGSISSPISNCESVIIYLEDWDWESKERTIKDNQHFDDDTLRTFPSDWIVVSGNIDANYSAFVFEGSEHGYNVYYSPYLILCDAQAGAHVDMYYPLSTTVSQGSFEFNYWLYGTDYWDTYHQIILEDSAGNDVILIVFSAQHEDHWHFSVGGVECVEIYDLMPPQPIIFMVEFYEAKLNVYINYFKVLSNIPYSGDVISQIRILTTDGTSTQGESWIDNMVITQYEITSENSTTSPYPNPFDLLNISGYPIGLVFFVQGTILVVIIAKVKRQKRKMK